MGNLNIVEVEVIAKMAKKNLVEFIKIIPNS
jgi:hypothetical protein